MPASIKLTGFGALSMVLDPKRFSRELRKQVRKATAINGRIAAAQVRSVIRAGGLAPNAPLTVAIKKSTKPLVDQGSLWQAITSRVEDDFTAFVGVLSTDDQYNVAVTLHEGAVIDVTKKMFWLFQNLWLASIGHLDPGKLTGRAAELWSRMPGGWRPLKETTRAIIIPPRPFIAEAFKDQGLHARARQNWINAVSASLRPGGGA